MESYSIKSFEQYKYLIYTGKGGVGKISTSSATAVGLVEEGRSVLLVSTDPAHHLAQTLSENSNLRITAIEEDLRSPCTQEIAVFRKFAKIV